MALCLFKFFEKGEERVEEQTKSLIFGNLPDILEAKRVELGIIKLKQKELLASDDHCYDCDGYCLCCEERESCRSPFKEELKRLQDEERESYKEYAILVGEYNFIQAKRKLLLDEIYKMVCEIRAVEKSIIASQFTKTVLESRLAELEKKLKDFESSH